MEESLRRGRRIIISEPVTTQGKSEGPQVVSITNPSTEAVEVESEMTVASPVRQSLDLVDEVSDRQLVIVTQPVGAHSGMPRPMKRRRIMGNESAPLPKVTAPFEGLGEDDFSSGSVREDVDVRRELLGIPMHDRSGFVRNALQAYCLVDNLILDHL